MSIIRSAWALACAALLIVSAPALSQHATASAAPAGFAPEYAPVTVAAASTAVTGTATTGTTVIGPFTPQLGRAIRVVLRGTWAGTVTFGTSVDACTTINPLTIAGTSWGSFTGNANEDIDVAMIATVVYCATATISSGSLSYAVRQ